MPSALSLTFSFPSTARKSLGLPGRLPPSTVPPQQRPPLSGGHSGLGTGAMVARSSDLPYLIVGVVLGSIVLLIVAFIPFCLWRAWSKQSKGCFLGADLQDMVCLWIKSDPGCSCIKYRKCEGVLGSREGKDRGQVSDVLWNLIKTKATVCPLSCLPCCKKTFGTRGKGSFSPFISKSALGAKIAAS